MVYPRVYGGTRNLHERSKRHSSVIGSIPACTGEPLVWGLLRRPCGVYPRVYGGTFPIYPRVYGGTPACRLCPDDYWLTIGLSPRVRGNQYVAARLGLYPRVYGGTAVPQGEVYPRVYGGT